jgi:hypothetical protein
MRKVERERRERLRRLVENLPPGRLLSSQFLVLDKAGSGAEGVVYRVRDQFTRTTRALKFYLDPNADQFLPRLAHKMSHLHHENIVRHFGVGHNTSRTSSKRWRSLMAAGSYTRISTGKTSCCTADLIDRTGSSWPS